MGTEFLPILFKAGMSRQSVTASPEVLPSRRGVRVYVKLSMYVRIQSSCLAHREDEKTFRGLMLATFIHNSSLLSHNAVSRRDLRVRPCACCSKHAQNILAETRSNPSMIEFFNQRHQQRKKTVVTYLCLHQEMVLRNTSTRHLALSCGRRPHAHCLESPQAKF